MAVDVGDDAVFPMGLFPVEGVTEDRVFGVEHVLGENDGEFPVHVDGLEDCPGGVHGKRAIFETNAGAA